MRHRVTPLHGVSSAGRQDADVMTGDPQDLLRLNAALGLAEEVLTGLVGGLEAPGGMEQDEGRGEGRDDEEEPPSEERGVEKGDALAGEEEESAMIRSPILAEGAESLAAGESPVGSAEGGVPSEEPTPESAEGDGVAGSVIAPEGSVIAPGRREVVEDSALIGSPPVDEGIVVQSAIDSPEGSDEGLAIESPPVTEGSEFESPTGIDSPDGLQAGESAIESSEVFDATEGIQGESEETGPLETIPLEAGDSGAKPLGGDDSPERVQAGGDKSSDDAGQLETIPFEARDVGAETTKSLGGIDSFEGVKSPDDAGPLETIPLEAGDVGDVGAGTPVARPEAPAALPLVSCPSVPSREWVMMNVTILSRSLNQSGCVEEYLDRGCVGCGCGGDAGELGHLCLAEMRLTLEEGHALHLAPWGYGLLMH
jgi:hypothetical protein